VTADRGYGAAAVDAGLTGLGVKFVAIVRKGRQSVARQTVERGPRFRRLVKWRTGSEGRISTLKRQYGWGRSLMDGLAGTQVWCGYGIFAHNSIKISGLIAARNDPVATAGPPSATSTDRPARPQPPPTLPLSA
jgi:transposase, IS5 family